MGGAALALGIIGLILGWIPIFGTIPALIFGIVAWILGAKKKKALRASENKAGIGTAITGMVFGIIGTVQGLIMLVIALGVVTPAVRSAVSRANASAMQTKGKKLWDAITIAGMDRMNAGKSDASVWPRSSRNMGDDSDDITGREFSTSTAYFEALFDVKNYGTVDWNPYVNGLDLSYLAGGGVPTAPGNVGSLDSRYNVWIVLKGVTDDTPSEMPVLITANVDHRALNALLATGKIYGHSNVRIPIGTTRTQPFGDKKFIIVRKDGTQQVYEGRYNRVCDIFRYTDVTIPAGQKLEYIAP